MIIFDIIGALISPFVSLLGAILVPVIVIGGILLLIMLLLSNIRSFETKEKGQTRYQNSHTPAGYRICVSYEQPSWSPSCYYCSHSKETYEEHGTCIKTDTITQTGERITNTVYCSKYDIDVCSYYTCDMRYSSE